MINEKKDVLLEPVLLEETNSSVKQLKIGLILFCVGILLEIILAILWIILGIKEITAAFYVISMYSLLAISLLLYISGIVNTSIALFKTKDHLPVNVHLLINISAIFFLVSLMPKLVGGTINFFLLAFIGKVEIASFPSPSTILFRTSMLTSLIFWILVTIAILVSNLVLKKSKNSYNFTTKPLITPYILLIPIIAVFLLTLLEFILSPSNSKVFFHSFQIIFGVFLLIIFIESKTVKLRIENNDK